MVWRLVNDKAGRKTNHCDTSTRPVLFLRTRWKMQVDIDGFGYLERVIRPHVRNTQIVGISLDPGQREFAALFNDLP
jgi:hypothetical protein